MTSSERTGQIIIDIILILVALTTVFPFLQVITVSLSTTADINAFGLHLFPKHFDLGGFKLLLGYSLIWRGYLNTIIRVLTGTTLSIFLTVLGAYALAQKELPNRTFWTGIIIFTMYFGGGLIPSYLLVKDLGLRNTLFALILPGAISTYNMIITRNFFMSLPKSLIESAKIDGANDFRILFQIVLPLSKAILATIALWYGVGQWNSWFDCMIYMDKESGYVLQMVLRRLLLQGQQPDPNGVDVQVINPDNMKMAAVIVATVPIMCIYPFFQKYFVKGVMVGSLKG